jgi:hypothetical protein
MNFAVALCHVVFLRNQARCPSGLPLPFRPALPSGFGVSRCRTSAFFSHFTLTRQRIRGTSCPLSCHGWGTANVDGSITDLIHDLTAPASPVALRCDLTWLSPLWRFAPRHPDAFRLGKPIRSLTLREMRSTGGGANRLGLAQADLRSVSGCRSRAKESECELRCGRPC